MIAKGRLIFMIFTSILAEWVQSGWVILRLYLANLQISQGNLMSLHIAPRQSTLFRDVCWFLNATLWERSADLASEKIDPEQSADCSLSDRFQIANTCTLQLDLRLVHLQFHQHHLKIGKLIDYSYHIYFTFIYLCCIWCFLFWWEQVVHCIVILNCRESLQQGWRMVAIVTAYFQCTDTLKPYILKYLEQAAYDNQRPQQG